MTAESLRCVPLELEELGRVIACYRKLSRVIAVIASYRGDNSVIAGPRTLRNRGAGPSSRQAKRKNASTHTSVPLSVLRVLLVTPFLQPLLVLLGIQLEARLEDVFVVTRGTHDRIGRGVQGREVEGASAIGQAGGGKWRAVQPIANYRKLSHIIAVIASYRGTITRPKGGAQVT